MNYTNGHEISYSIEKKEAQTGGIFRVCQRCVGQRFRFVPESGQPEIINFCWLSQLVCRTLKTILYLCGILLMNEIN